MSAVAANKHCPANRKNSKLILVRVRSVKKSKEKEVARKIEHKSERELIIAIKRIEAAT